MPKTLGNMEINYEIGTINNVNGEGDKHLYVALDLQPALTTKRGTGFFCGRALTITNPKLA